MALPQFGNRSHTPSMSRLANPRPCFSSPGMELRYPPFRFFQP
jgi:hypothetical protein